MESFLHKMTWHPDDVCWEGNYYKHSYPKSFNMRPQSGTTVPSTLNRISHPDLTFRNCKFAHDYGKTTTGLAHGEKILGRQFQSSIMKKAADMHKITYIFPHCENWLQKTRRGFNYNPQPFNVSVTKTDYCPKRRIADFDYTNGSLVNIPPPRAIRVSQAITKPGFQVDEMYGIFRKFNPYMSTTKTDYVNVAKEKKKFESSFCG